jgi:hypothetical protein
VKCAHSLVAAGAAGANVFGSVTSVTRTQSQELTDIRKSVDGVGPPAVDGASACGGGRAGTRTNSSDALSTSGGGGGGGISDFGASSRVPMLPAHDAASVAESTHIPQRLSSATVNKLSQLFELCKGGE